MFNFFLNHDVYEIMWGKNTVEPDKPHKTT